MDHAPDLTQRPPRSPRVRLGGYAILPRILDKCRASLAGKEGLFHYNSGFDQHFFRFTGIGAEAMKAEVAKGGGDGEVLAWIEKEAPHQRKPWEIEQWSAFQERRGPDSDRETLLYFADRLAEFSSTREDIKGWMDLLDLDDHCSFGGKA